MTTHPDLVLTGADIIGPAGALPSGSAVVVEGGLVAGVVHGADLPHESPHRRVELPAGSTLLPGLIDSHVHLCDWGAPAHISNDPAKLTLHAAAHARLSQRAGITTVRDVGAPWGIGQAIREAVARGSLLGSTVVAAGRLICMTGGHGSELGKAGTFARIADGPDDCRKAVREEVAAGVDWIKIVLDGARDVPGKRVLEFTQAEVDAVVDEAHRLGVRVAAHVFTPPTADMAIKAGADSLEHGLELSEQNVADMAERGTTLVPTIRLPLHIIDLRDEMLSMGEYGEHALRHAEGALPTHAASFQRALAAGVTIVAGTDTSSFVGGLDSLVSDLEYMVELGMTTAQALSSATDGAAELLERTGRIGTVEAGARADLLVVAGNPLEEISALRRTQLVVQGGRVVAASRPVGEALGDLYDVGASLT